MARKLDKTQYGNSKVLSEQKLSHPHIVEFSSKYKTNDEGTTVAHKDCLCVDCQQVFEFESKIARNSWSEADMTVVCPDCGTVEKPAKVVNGPKQKYGTVVINVPKKEVLYVSHDESGNCTKMDDVTMYDNFRIYSSGKMFIEHSKEIVSYDLVTNQVTDTHVTSSGKLISHRNMENKFSGALRDMGARMNIPDDYQSCDFTSKPNDEVENYVPSRSYSSNNNVTKAKYDELVAKPYGLPTSDKLSSENLNKMETMCNFVVLYPGVMEREINRYNENYSYHPENFPNPEDDRFALVEHTECMVSLMDSKLSSDLHKAKSAEEVTALLRSVTFGEKNGELAGDIQVEDAVTKGYGTLKNLKKEFNINPYATASNVRTMRKLGIEDPSHVKMMCDIAKDSVVEGVPFSGAAACQGVLRPVETRGQMRFLKTYAAAHGSYSIVTDWYTPGARGASTFDDCIRMYDKVCAVGKVAASKQDAEDARLYDARRQVGKIIENQGLESAYSATTLNSIWNDKTKQCVDLIHEMNERDKAAGVTIPVIYATRNGEPLMSKSPHEIHDELSNLMERVKGENRPIKHTPAEHERFDKDIGEFHFRLALDTDELVTTGTRMGICVGGHDEDALSGREHIIIMYDKEYTPVGCISTNSDMTCVDQIKAHHNGMICNANKGSAFDIKPEDAVSAVEEWCEVTELNTSRSEDYKRRNDANYYPYGNQNHAVRRRNVMQELPPADYVIQKTTEKLNYSKSVDRLKAVGSEFITSDIITEEQQKEV